VLITTLTKLLVKSTRNLGLEPDRIGGRIDRGLPLEVHGDDLGTNTFVSRDFLRKVFILLNGLVVVSFNLLCHVSSLLLFDSIVV